MLGRKRQFWSVGRTSNMVFMVTEVLRHESMETVGKWRSFTVEEDTVYSVSHTEGWPSHFIVSKFSLQTGTCQWFDYCMQGYFCTMLFSLSSFANDFPLSWISPDEVVIKERLTYGILISSSLKKWGSHYRCLGFKLPADNKGERSENKTGVNISLYIQYNFYCLQYNCICWITEFICSL